MDDDEALAMVTRILGPMRRVEADVPYRVQRMRDSEAAAPKTVADFLRPKEMPE